MNYIRLLRPKDWAKNLFLYIPLFFAGELFNLEKIFQVSWGILAFCCVASSIYIINDYRDREDDRIHPVKKSRPIAAGTVNSTVALGIAIALLAGGFTLAWFIRDKFLFVLAIYFVINLGYSMGLKQVSILDMMLLATGFVLRIKGGSVISDTPLSEWIVVMVFLLSLFMAIGKRRDDVQIKLSSGMDMRKSVKGYTLEYLNTCLALVSAVIIVAYFMYTMAPETMERHGTYRLYYTCIFVIMGIMRYLQIIFVKSEAGSPTKILYNDLFIKISLLLWIASYILIIYLKEYSFFN